MRRVLGIVLILAVTINLYGQKATEDSITRLYVATFDRAPDRSGVDYWLNSSNLTLEDIATSFFEQKETQERYPDGYGDKNFVNSVYSNLFKRRADSVGESYWIEQLKEEEISKSLFILAVINGAVGDDATILENKTSVGLEFIKSASDNIKQAYSVMADVDKSRESVINAFNYIDNITLYGVCDNNIKNGCDYGSSTGEYESDDYYIWFCQNSKNEISNQCQIKKESTIAECNENIKNGCSVGIATMENQSDDYYSWYCKTDETLSYECKIKRGADKNIPECNNAVKNGCDVGSYVDDSEDDEFYYWYCKTDKEVSSKCQIIKEPTSPKCSDDEYKCIYGVVYDKEGSYDFDDKFKWSCKTDRDSIDCEKEKEKVEIEIDAMSEKSRVWSSLECYDYSGDSKEQGYIIQFDYKEYAGRCASSVEVKSYNTTRFNEDRLISTLKNENQSDRDIDFCLNAYKDDENGSKYSYRFNATSKDSCFKTIYKRAK